MKTRFYIFLSMAFGLLMQTSCIYDNNSVVSCGAGDAELLVINLNLTVPSSSVGTRSGDHDYSDVGSKDESYIDIAGDDYQILMFDRDGNLVDDKLSEFEWKENGVVGNSVSYTLTARLEISDSEEKERLGKFRVMVLTNWNSFETSNTRSSFDYPSFSNYNLSAIYGDGENFNFTLGSDNSSWVPSITDRKAIPMFGVTDEQDLQLAIDMARYGDEPSFNVSMLRSLAKIEIVDMVPDGESANIEKCVLTKYNTSGRFIPDIEKNPAWNDLKTQVTIPSLPDEVNLSENLQFFKTTKTVRTKDATEDEVKDCYVAYIPEMELGTEGRPVIQVQLDGQNYTIELSDYSEGKPRQGGEYLSLLRNHNYRFDIVSVGSTELDFLIQTSWEEEDAGEWVYEDLKIEFEPGKEFTWDLSNPDPETNLPKFESAGAFEARTIIITQDDWLEGTFQLKSPSQSKWTLSVYGDDNTLNDHFHIETGTKRDETDMDGGVYEIEEWAAGAPSISGEVGEEVLFRIIPTAVNNSNDHYVARVVLTCTTFDDRMIEVNLPYFHEQKYKVAESEMQMPTLENNGYYYVKQYYSGFKDLDDNEPERPGGMDSDSD